MVLLANIPKQVIDQYGTDKKYWIAYSGGIDSHVLLQLFANYRSIKPFDLQAIHVNHGLNPHADDWQQHCRQICSQLNVNFHAKKINNHFVSGESPEALARKRRYAVLKELLHSGDILLTAHQQDDQAETLLIQLFRGAGPKGLAAMPKEKKFGAGFLVRPLLHFSRQQLQAYAVSNQLQWIEDSSNKNNKFARNFIRNDVMPLLKKRWPSVTMTLSRAAKHCGEMQNLIEKKILTNVVTPDASVSERSGIQCLFLKKTLSMLHLLSLNSIEQALALRHWLSQQNVPLPSEKKLLQFQRDLLSANQDKNPHITWGEFEARRYQDVIYVMTRKPEHDPKQEYTWNFSKSLVIPNIGTLTSTSCMSRGLRADLQEVTVRFRQGGERIQLSGRTHTHCLKKLFQEWKIPPWERDRIPLIYVENELAAVGGLCVSHPYAALPDQPSRLINLTYF